MKKIFLILLLLFATVLSSCSTLFNRDAIKLQTARDCLESFFSLLSFGAYEQAAFLYGGSYSELQTMNPSISPDNAIALWENACTTNGFKCLQIKQILNEYEDKDGIFHFVVEFKHRDGGTLVIGPCCGADATQMPPRSQFEYTVIRRQGKFLVQELPVFEP
jgi:hypothetical protein